MLEDGTYEVVVVDATDDAGIVVLDLAVLTGPHKGDVVTVRADGLDRTRSTCSRIPATLTVAGGEPSVRLED